MKAKKIIPDFLGCSKIGKMSKEQSKMVEALASKVMSRDAGLTMQTRSGKRAKQAMKDLVEECDI